MKARLEGTFLNAGFVNNINVNFELNGSTPQEYLFKHWISK